MRDSLTARTGLIIGKFDPPHRGHSFVIETALAQVDQLDVLVCQSAQHMLSGTERATLLRHIHPTIQTHIIDQDTFEIDDPQAWVAATLELVSVPDVIFSSENYGEGYAKMLDCKHVMVDEARRMFPISGTLLRSDLQKYADCLHPHVARHLGVA